MSIIRDNIEDLRVIDTNTNAITDIKESSLSKVASNVLLSGNLALASSAVTKSNANITYTGNGSTQSITTGIASVDFTVASNGSGYYHDRVAGDCIVKNDAGVVVESGECVVNTSKVHIKSRSSIRSHNIYDGLRGASNQIYSNLTYAETSDPRILFSTTGFTLINGQNEVNENAIAYIAHQTLYTHIKWGLTNQGKRYITAYNPVTREVMTMYQGSGIAGHQIPNPLGIKLDYWEVKNLNLVDNWMAFSTAISSNQHYIIPNLTLAATYSSAVFNDNTDDYIEVGSNDKSNGVGQTLISYGFANSETKIITQYQGTGAAGNFVETKDVNGVAKKPRRVILKCINLDTSWNVIDTERGIGSGSEPYIDLNSSLKETTYNFGYLTPNGIMFEGTGNSLNDPNGQYIAIVEFDTTNSNDDTYFDLPTDDTNLNVTAGKLPYTDGRDTTNGAYNVFTQSYTGSVDFSTCPDGIHYVALDSNNAPKFYKEPKVGIDGFNVWFDKDSGKWYEPYNLVTNGDFSNGLTGYVLEDNDPEIYITANSVVLGNQSTIRQDNIDVSVGVTYKIQYEITSNDYRMVSYFRNQNGSILEDNGWDFSTGVRTFIYTIPSGVLSLQLRFLSQSVGATITNISVTLVEYDTSILTELSNPISFIDDKPYQVASGTPMDRLVDYPSIPKNVMESSYVDGDLEVSGEVKGKNQCTAWVNFDGTTTPPTIRDSFNVKDVVRTATGEFTLYFEEKMDNANYSVNGTAGRAISMGNGRIVSINKNEPTVDKLSVSVVNDSAGETNDNYVMINIVGGK